MPVHVVMMVMVLPVMMVVPVLVRMARVLRRLHGFRLQPFGHVADLAVEAEETAGDDRLGRSIGFQESSARVELA